jgi:hypothetical protein
MNWGTKGLPLKQAAPTRSLLKQLSDNVKSSTKEIPDYTDDEPPIFHEKCS